MKIPTRTRTADPMRNNGEGILLDLLDLGRDEGPYLLDYICF